MTRERAYLSDAWKKTFPDTDVAAALEFMHTTWAQLVQQFPDAIHPTKCNEPSITQTFGEHLQVKGRVSALSGIFDYEVPKAGKIDPITGKRTKRFRTDILYQDSAVRFASGQRLALIFEFKKLKNTGGSRTTYAGPDGMQRFISGYYKDHAEHVAFMVGLIHQNALATIDAMEIRLKRADTRSLLHIQPAIDGSYVRKPSALFCKSVNFDTVHSRTSDAEIGDLTLCHFFLEH
jgi:hypothetical protein